MLLTIIMSLFSSILIGLAPCNSNCAALGQENTIGEKKTKSNYFDINTDSSGTYYRYSLNALLSDSYWTNMIASFNSSGDLVIPNSDGSNPTYNDVLNNGVVYNMSSSLYSTFKFYYMGNTSLVEIPLSSNNCFTAAYLYCQNSSYSMKLFYIHLYYTRAGNTGDCLISCLYNPVMHSFGTTYTINGTGLPSNIYFAFLASDNPLALQEGTSASFDNGYNSGYDKGYDFGYDEGYDNGYDAGKEIAQNPDSDIYQSIYGEGYNKAIIDVLNPDDAVYQGIYNEGRQVGDSEGYQRAISQGSTAATIFSGIVTVGLLPVNVLLTMFQYEVFGINIAGLVSGLFTIAVVIIIIRLVTGKKND